MCLWYGSLQAAFQYKIIRLPDLLIHLEMPRNEGKYANPVLLIIDEGLLLKLNEKEHKDIFELIHRRRKKSSTVFCSQYQNNGWYQQLGGEASLLSAAILDRIVHDEFKINIERIDPSNDISMSEVYCLDKSLSE